MRRGAKPGKAKVDAKPPIGRKRRKSEGSRVGDGHLEQVPLGHGADDLGSACGGQDRKFERLCGDPGLPAQFGHEGRTCRIYPRPSPGDSHIRSLEGRATLQLQLAETDRSPRQRACGQISATIARCALLFETRYRLNLRVRT